jgi:hypothetical protein
LICQFFGLGRILCWYLEVRPFLFSVDDHVRDRKYGNYAGDKSRMHLPNPTRQQRLSRVSCFGRIGISPPAAVNGEIAACNHDADIGAALRASLPLAAKSRVFPKLLCAFR